MAGKARVHELAKELGVTSKDVLAKLNELGEFVKSASSTVEAPVARRLRESFPADAPKKAPAKKAPAKKAAPAPAAAPVEPVAAAPPSPPGGCPGIAGCAARPGAGRAARRSFPLPRPRPRRVRRRPRVRLHRVRPRQARVPRRVRPRAWPTIPSASAGEHPRPVLRRRVRPGRHPAACRRDPVDRAPTRA